MTTQPAYFEQIRKKASQRWDQLESDPGLAGPWRQLFRQIQSPRHVLSELLQNADDAGATMASVSISNEIFTFTHNGEDFKEEHFESLCQFGYSNKRSLHTIGFRGVGFKSTFSLGDPVRLYSPTLSVEFHRKRFTEPKPIPPKYRGDNLTRVVVNIDNSNSQLELEKNLKEWLDSPVSLLFFNSIHALEINNTRIEWKEHRKGPVSRSRWMTLSNDPDKQYLLLTSKPQQFPQKAIDEIREERGVEHLSLPPVKVEIVLGVSGRLFVVLPTGVEPNLPFVCNAPFIQDPTRFLVKGLTSETNRWLFEQIGELASDVFLAWLNNKSLSIEERAEAYRLFPNVNRHDYSLQGVVATHIEESFENAIAGKPILLTENGKVVLPNQATHVPSELHSVWELKHLKELLINSQSILSRCITEQDVVKLSNWQRVSVLKCEDIVELLKAISMVKPQSWRQLLNLWIYLASEVTRYKYFRTRDEIRIIPVQGKSHLYSAREIVRLGEKRLLNTSEDWQFLSEYLLVMNQNWMKYVQEQRRIASTENNEALLSESESVYSLLKSLGLGDTDDTSKIINKVASRFFNENDILILDCIRISHIAAKLGITVDDSFKFKTNDESLRSADYPVIYDLNGKLDELVSQEFYNEHVLNYQYQSRFISCNSEEWKLWLTSGRAKLFGFVPLVKTTERVFSKNELTDRLKKRKSIYSVSYKYSTEHFIIEDWDFSEDLWLYWNNQANSDKDIWGKILECIIIQPSEYWKHATNINVKQVATTGNSKAILNDAILCSWIIRLQKLPCLPDNHGSLRQPVDLLRRTHETEAFLDVERFIDSRLDNERNRPLLDLLGVRNKPSNPEQLLAFIKVFAGKSDPPVQEVVKWYNRLDQQLNFCSEEEVASIRGQFHSEKLVLTNDLNWSNAKGVFITYGDTDIPDIPVIHPDVKHLSIWRKIDVAERPTEDLTIDWLKTIPSGEKLSKEDLKRVKSILARYPTKVWINCAHWLNLNGEWSPCNDLKFLLSMQSLIPWSNLHDWVKQQTADMQNISSDVTEASPFNDIPKLADVIELRLNRDSDTKGKIEHKEWVNQLGNYLCRIDLGNEEDNHRLYHTAKTLTDTRWQVTPGLEILPYIANTPAGLPRNMNAVWLDNIIYVEDQPIAKLALAVAKELGRFFNRPEINDAIKMCFDRPSEYIYDYIVTNFRLLPVDANDTILIDGELATEEQIDLITEPISELQELPSPNSIEDDLEYIEPSVETKPLLSETSDDGVIEQPNGDRSISDIPKSPPVKHKESLIEVFALKNGYRRDNNGGFVHPNGNRLTKTDKVSSFPWERRSISGDGLHYYLPLELCWEKNPVKLEAEQWGLLNNSPNMYSLILQNSNGEPEPKTGQQLLKLLETGILKLYPAIYRLVLENDQKA